MHQGEVGQHGQIAGVNAKFMEHHATGLGLEIIPSKLVNVRKPVFMEEDMKKNTEHAKQHAEAHVRIVGWGNFGDTSAHKGTVCILPHPVRRLTLDVLGPCRTSAVE